jgi:hypothetical protein
MQEDEIARAIFHELYSKNSVIIKLFQKQCHYKTVFQEQCRYKTHQKVTQ